MKRRTEPKPVTGAIERVKQQDLAAQPRLAARIALSLCAMVIGLIVLAANTSMPNVTRAPGEILPQGNYSQVETLEGGIVNAIHVSEGQAVAAGAPLVDLKQPDLLRNIATLAGQKEHKRSQFDNLQALKASLSTGELPTQDSVNDLRLVGLVSAADQLDLHVQNQSVKALAIAQQSETIAILETSLAFSEQRVAAKTAQMETTRSLRKQGLITESQLQVEQDQLNALQTAANAARVELANARSALTQKIAERDRAHLDLQEQTREDLQQKEQELIELTSLLVEENARLRDLSIAAPEGGVVQSVAFPNLGEVIEPGETLFEIVAAKRGLVVEARIPSNDIGHIDMAQPVSIGVDTFDQRRFGRVTGHLLSLSPVSITDEVTGERYFRAAIGLDRPTIGIGSQERSLSSGMTVIAEIVTGEQTVLAYFLKPIDTTLSKSFSER
ncbi:HlyD family type I secretion periplasmic adaptor subunit [Algirhabdus cladophorae]|uniref:HlyD family type I secretion periplasmic adaptor subunit n=1 Tax=Algirhabdus cladophorae TaxID=3377108 RepID=UPI003B8480D2